MTAARRNIMVCTAGHVDHGKTALARMLTGCDLDTLKEEKRRGLTIELGFAPCRLANDSLVGIVDVPGHVGFIRTMVAGAQGVDFAILVVAADDGVMPQTREHLDILGLVGVRRGLVALTKVDLVDADLRALVIEDLRQTLAPTFLAEAPICPVSNVTGAGYDAFFEQLNRLIAACPPRPTGGLFKLWVERSFTIRGFGTVVSGVPTAGQVRVGDRLRVVPGDRAVRVRRLEVYGQEADVGRAGECVALNLADVHEPLARGQVLCAGETCQPVSMIEVDLGVLGDIGKPIKDGAELHVHVGTAEIMGHLALVEGRTVDPGERRLAQLRLAEPVGASAGERFVIRAPAGGHGADVLRTVGGGRVVGTSNLRLRRNRPWTLAALADQRDALDSPAAWVALCLEQAGAALALADVARRSGHPEEETRGLLDELVAAGRVVLTARRLYLHDAVVRRTGERVQAALADFAAANPRRAGMSDDELAHAVEVDREVLAVAVERLVAGGVVRRAGPSVCLVTAGVGLDAADQALCDRLGAALAAAGLAPPSVGELAAALAADPQRTADLVAHLCDRGDVVRLDADVAMHATAVAAAEAVVRRLLAEQGWFETPTFRDAVGVSRKFAVPLLDYFDRVRLTVRSASRRTPGARARQGPVGENEAKSDINRSI